MLKVYLAAPLFNDAERRFNQDLTEQLESRGFTVFLPQRDGPEHDDSYFPTLSIEERREAIFAVDRMQILDCDVFLFILDGRVPDEGACVELGIAYAQRYLLQRKKVIVGLHTDARAAFMGNRVNPMIGQALDYIFSKREDLFSYLEKRPGH